MVNIDKNENILWAIIGLTRTKKDDIIITPSDAVRDLLKLTLGKVFEKFQKKYLTNGSGCDIILKLS